MPKPANTDHPVHELIAARWSPYSFADRDVSDGDLRSVFEAARWAASSFNEQPWRYIVARRADADAFAKALGCLVEPNRAWARAAPVLALAVVSESFQQNGKANRVAEHDLGLASATLTVQATARGMAVHQMGGILPDRVREEYGVPEGYHAVTALAIGYEGEPSRLEGPLAGRDDAPRARRPLAEFVFGDRFDQAARFIS